MSVHLVGAGPGASDLLTLRAARLLRVADVVVHDRLIDPEVLALAHPLARLIDVGKQPGRSDTQAAINELLIDLGRTNDCVVRLKGGDPFVFGRGGEEYEALANAGVACEVVPGVTSAFAAPLVAGIPVTHRGLSHGVLVVTGRARAEVAVDFRSLANSAITLVVLMGVERRGEIARELIEGGLSRSTPVAAVEQAYMSDQCVRRGELHELGSMDVRSPAVLVIGAVAALAMTHLENFLGHDVWSMT